MRADFSDDLMSLYEKPVYTEVGNQNPQNAVYPFQPEPVTDEPVLQQSGTDDSATNTDVNVDDPGCLCEVPVLEIGSVEVCSEFVQIVYRTVFGYVGTMQTARLHGIRFTPERIVESGVITIPLAPFVRDICSPFREDTPFVAEAWTQYVSIGLLPRLNRMIESWIGEESCPSANPFRVLFFGKNGILTGVNGFRYEDVQERMQAILPELKDAVQFVRMKYKGPAILVDCISPKDVTENIQRRI